MYGFIGGMVPGSNHTHEGFRDTLSNAACNNPDGGTALGDRHNMNLP